MDIQRLKSKLGLSDGATEFTSASSTEDKPYLLHIFADEGGVPHFTFESQSLDVTYFTDNEHEMLVAIRDTIKDMDSLSRIQVEGDKVYRWSAGPVTITATKLGDKTYKVVRENKMVSSSTEMSRMNTKSHVLRKLGIYPLTDIRVDKPEDALYVFLANFETARLDRNELKESLQWTYKIVCMLEGRKLKLPAKLDGQRSGMLARQVKAVLDGEELKGVLVNLRLGTHADVLVEGKGIIRVPKTDVWI